MDLDRSAELYNAVGVAAVEQIGTVDTKILVYAESGEDFFQVLVRHSPRGSDVVDSLKETTPVIDALDELFSFLEQAGEKHVWKSMEYVVDHGQVDAELSYDDVFGGDLELWEKSPKLLEKHFPGKSHR